MEGLIFKFCLGPQIWLSRPYWEVILMGCGCGLICGLSSGYIFSKKGRPWWFMRYIEVLQLKLMLRRTYNIVRPRATT